METACCETTSHNSCLSHAKNDKQNNNMTIIRFTPQIYDFFHFVLLTERSKFALI